MTTKLNYELLTFDNAVFSCYITWGCILLLKVLFMAPGTGVMRMKTKVKWNDISINQSGLM